MSNPHAAESRFRNGFDQTSTMRWKNVFTDRLKIDYPIIQAPMLGVSTPEMAAAVSNECGLGSLPVGGLSPEATRQLFQKTKQLTLDNLIQWTKQKDIAEIYLGTTEKFVAANAFMRRTVLWKFKNSPCPASFRSWRLM